MFGDCLDAEWSMFSIMLIAITLNLIMVSVVVSLLHNWLIFAKNSEQFFL